MKLKTNEPKAEDKVVNVEETAVQTDAAEQVEDISSLSLEEKVIYWKNKYKKLYKTEIDGDTYIWRRINRSEYGDIAFMTLSDNSNKDIYEKRYLFCKTAVLYPDNITEIMDDSAGICMTLADEIIYKSGFSNPYPTTEEI